MPEMYGQGVQVRKVSKVIENMCGKTYSKVMWEQKNKDIIFN